MLMADVTIDARVMPKAEITIDLNAPFDAHQFYVQQRDWGLDPHVRSGGLYFGINGQIEDERVGQWAARHDPDGSQRIEYARAAWAKRTSDDEVIALGVDIEQLEAAAEPPFFGARCPSYPACSGGCGLGCSHEMSAS